MLAGREEGTLSITFCPSEAVHLPSPREPVGCNAPATQVEGERKGGSGSLGMGTSPLAGRRQTRGVSLSRRAEGSGQPLLSAVGCHRHIKQPAELLSARTQRGSILPNRNRGGKDRAISPAALSWLTSRPVLAGLPDSPVLQSPCNSPHREGAKGLSSWSSSPSRTQPRCVLYPSNPVWGPSALSRKMKIYSRPPKFGGAGGGVLVPDTQRDVCVHVGRGFLQDLIVECPISLSLSSIFPSYTFIFPLIDKQNGREFHCLYPVLISGAFKMKNWGFLV